MRAKGQVSTELTVKPGRESITRMATRSWSILLLLALAGCSGTPNRPWATEGGYHRVHRPDDSILLIDYPWLVESASYARETGYAWWREPDD